MSTETQRAKFEAFVLEKTGRDVEYHGRAGTTGLAFAYACWRAAQSSQAAEIEALKADIATKYDVIRAMLAALEESVDMVAENYNTDWRHGVPTRQAQLDGKYELLEAHRAAIEQGKAAMQTKEAS